MDKIDNPDELTSSAPVSSGQEGEVAGAIAKLTISGPSGKEAGAGTQFKAGEGSTGHGGGHGQQPSPGPQNTTVFVGSIPFEATEPEIRQFFSKCGQIQNLRMLCNATGRFKGSCFIRFDSLEASERACALNGHRFMTRTLYVSMSTSRPPAAKGAPPEGCKTVFVGNMDQSLGEESLRGLFKDCGTIVEVKLIKDKYTGHSRGFAFVTFAEPQSAHEAVKLSHSVLADRHVKVDYQRPRPNSNTNPGGKGHHHHMAPGGVPPYMVAHPGSPYLAAAGGGGYQPPPYGAPMAYYNYPPPHFYGGYGSYYAGAAPGSAGASPSFSPYPYQAAPSSPYSMSSATGSPSPGGSTGSPKTSSPSTPTRYVHQGQPFGGAYLGMSGGPPVYSAPHSPSIPPVPYPSPYMHSPDLAAQGYPVEYMPVQAAPELILGVSTPPGSAPPRDSAPPSDSSNDARPDATSS